MMHSGWGYCVCVLCIVGVLCIPLMSHSNCTVPLLGSLGGSCLCCVYMYVCVFASRMYIWYWLLQSLYGYVWQISAWSHDVCCFLTYCHVGFHAHEWKITMLYVGGSIARWLVCWTQAQKARVQIAVATLSDNSLRQTEMALESAICEQSNALVSVLTWPLVKFDCLAEVLVCHFQHGLTEFVLYLNGGWYLVFSYYTGGYYSGTFYFYYCLLYTSPSPRD